MFLLSESFHRVLDKLERVSGRVPTGSRWHAQVRVIHREFLYECVGKV